MDISELIGKTAVVIANEGDALIFNMDDGTKYKMHHYQNCCESVTIEDICGDLEDLVGTPFTQAVESTNHNNDEYSSETWTFYILGTNKGSVTIRWYGTSNGYYSESVDFDRVE